MSEVNERIEEIVVFLSEGDGFAKSEFLIDLLGEISELNGYSPDEISLNWNHDELMILDIFVNKFHDKYTEKICNAINSFKDR